jgi:5-enolpyruvylshikimate-3-phosphate synthase
MRLRRRTTWPLRLFRPAELLSPMSVGKVYKEVAAVRHNFVFFKPSGLDTAFCYLLQLMGCRVEQTDQSTTVRYSLPLLFIGSVSVTPSATSGPEKGRLSAVSINMTDMTDSFMTAAVLCAVAEGTSSLYGIANQVY